MWDIFRSIGVLDNLKQKGSLKYYKEKLHEYQENEADVLIDMGLLYYEDEKYDESLYHLKKAANIYSLLYEIESEAFTQDLIGDVYLSIRKIDKALERYQKSFQLYSAARSSMKDELFEKIKEVNDIKEAIELANEDNIDKELEERYSDISTKEDDFEEFKKENDESSVPYIEKKDINSCDLSYDKISFKIEEIMKIIKKKYNVKEPSKTEYESGYFQKCIYEAHKKRDNKKEVALLQVISNLLMKNNKPYSAMQNLKTAFNISHETGDKKGEAFSLLLLGVVYCLLGKEDKIYDIFKQSLIIFKEIEFKNGEKIAIDTINALYDEDTCLDIDSSIQPNEVT
jgi:tetratricopeptide (TPR) repeat protein